MRHMIVNVKDPSEIMELLDGPGFLRQRAQDSLLRMGIGMPQALRGVSGQGD